MELRQPKVVLKVSQIPDWGRRAIRLSLALTFFTTIAITLWPVPEPLRAEWGDEVRQTCNWAGASCAVVAASPLIGKVAQLSYERTLGTLTGGLLGYLVYDFGVLQLSDTASDILMVVSAAAVGALSCYLSYKFSLDASMRLFVITFLIVVFGGGSHSALGVALLRTGGIITGVLLFMGLTVVILPKSATIEALREMKKGLKLLTELNTLVWTSKQEAEAALKAAADKARAAEVAAANAASTATKAASLTTGQSSAGGSWPAGAPGSKKSLWWSVSTALGAMFGPKADQYQPLPEFDPEMATGPGTAAASPAVWPAALQAAGSGQAAGRGVQQGYGDAAAAAGGGGGGSSLKGLGQTTSNGHAVSRLTQALQQAGSTKGFNQLPVSDRQQQQQQHPSDQSQPQPQQQQLQQPPQSVSYQQFMAEYEERCEAVLTKVYQSMFKVKEHVQLSESELYVHHFCGHYVFLPMFFNKALFNWLFPKRWRLPAAALEEVSTSVRVIARLLWTVHLDFSQEGFDEVIQALPAAAGMSNLLLDVAACTSSSLGVLVEAFPNKEAVLVDHLKALEALVNRMLEVSGDEHEGLIRELAANRPKPARPHRAESAGGPPHSPMHSQPHHQQQGTPRYGSHSPFAGLAQDLGSRPAAAPVAAVSNGDGPPERFASTSSAAARLGLDMHSPRAGQQQQEQQQQEPRQEVWFVTYHDHDDDGDPLGASAVNSSSMAMDGPGPPIPAESPELWSPPTPATAASPSAAAHSVAAAGPHRARDSFIFDMADSPEGQPAAAPAHAAAAGGAGDGRSTADMDSSIPATAGPGLSRIESNRSSLGVSSSLIRSQFRPMVKVPTLKLRPPHRLSQVHPVDVAASQALEPQPQLCGSVEGLPQGSPPAGISRAAAAGAMTYMRSVSAPDQAAADAAVALLRDYQQQQQKPPALSPPRQQQQQQQTAPVLAPASPAVTAAAAGGGDSSGGGGGVSMSLVLQALDDPETMSFVKLTRWYSFQFLMMELLIELHDLYHHIREVLTTLPHGL